MVLDLIKLDFFILKSTIFNVFCLAKTTKYLKAIISCKPVRDVLGKINPYPHTKSSIT